MSTVDPLPTTDPTTDPATEPATDPATRREPSHRVRRLWLVVVATTLVVLVLAEVSVRVAADRLPEPFTWYHPVAQVKVGQMAQRAAEGRGAAESDRSRGGTRREVRRGAIKTGADACTWARSGSWWRVGWRRW